MRRIIHSTLFALTMTLTAMPFHASAKDKLLLQLGPNGVQIDRACDPDREYCGNRRDSRRDWNNNGDEGCSQYRALRKAERMGIRRARVVDFDRRIIDVRGRRDGESIEVSFYRRDRSCPIAY